MLRPTSVAATVQAPRPLRTAHVTVVVVTWNGAHLLPACLDGLARQTLPVDVVVVDNGSTDGTADLLARRYPWVRTLWLPTNTGFAGGARTGMAEVATSYVALLNNDAVPEPAWAAALLAELEAHPEAAAATSRMLLPDGRVNNTGVVVTRWGNGVDRGYGDDPSDWQRPDEVEAISCGAALLRTAASRSVGGIAAESFLYYEDLDLSARLTRAGWTLRYAPTAVVVHEHAASSDPHSETFAFYNLRNHLLYALRALPPVTVAAAVGRFLLVSLVDAVRPRPGRPALHDPRLRGRVLRDVLRLAPAALRAR